MGLEKNSESPEGKHDTAAGAGFTAVESTHREGRKSMRGCGITALLWFAAVVLIFVFRPDPEKGGPWGIITAVSYGYLLLVGPAFGILYGMELVAYLNWRKKKGLGTTLWRVFMGFWLLLFAALFLAFGLACVIGGIDGLIRMKDAEDMGANVMATILGLLLGGVAWLLGWLAFRRKSESTEAKDIAAEEERKRAWEALDFAALEQQLGCTLPTAYKAMMQPGGEWREKEWTLFPKGLDDDDELYSVLELEPPSAHALRQHPATGETMLCFALEELGEYWLKPGSEDPPVYEYYTDGRPTLEEVAPRLSVFLSWPKE